MQQLYEEHLERISSSSSVPVTLPPEPTESIPTDDSSPQSEEEKSYSSSSVKRNENVRKEVVSIFRPPVGPFAIKNRVVEFVQAGLALLSTPDMKESITHAFMEDGKFSLMRSPDAYNAAKRSRVETMLTSSSSSTNPTASIIDFENENEEIIFQVFDNDT